VEEHGRKLKSMSFGKTEIDEGTWLLEYQHKRKNFRDITDLTSSLWKPLQNRSGWEELKPIL
jgi:hypothetical protein